MTVPINDDYPIQPDHLDLTNTGHLWDTFGSIEVEAAAWKVLKYCQARGEGWKPVALSELNQFCQEQWGAHFSHPSVLRLTGYHNPLVTHPDDATIVVTHFLVTTAFAKHPAKSTAGVATH